MAKAKHPTQPVVWVGNVIRFKQNTIVRYLLDYATPRGYGLNELACMGFSTEDRVQLAQLIGYSVSGFGDLSYAPRSVVRAADEEAGKLIAERDRKKRKRKRKQK